MKNAVKILIIIIIIFFIKTFFKWIIGQYPKDISYHFPIIISEETRPSYVYQGKFYLKNS